MSIVKHIPNTITCLNLFSGCIAGLLAVEGHLELAAVFVLLAAAFDYMDGLAARALKAYSAMGKELDSLADMVSFGFTPGLIAFGYLKLAVLGDVSADLNPEDLSVSQIVILLSAFMIPVFSALRLARFNVDERQITSFVGVPTPANAMFWASIPLVLYFGKYPTIQEWIKNPLVLIAVIVLTSLLLTAEIPMFALKVQNLKWRDNKIIYLFLISLIVLALLFKWLAIPLILVMYILFSIIENLTSKK